MRDPRQAATNYLLAHMSGGILSDADIDWQIRNGGLVIDPLRRPIQPNSIDLHVGRTISVPRGGRLIDPMKGLGVKDDIQELTCYHLKPDDCVNIATLERVTIPTHLVGKIEGKSTYARFHVIIEMAGFVESGWDGILTLELKNLGKDTLVLRPEMKIAQIVFFPVFNLPVLRPYGHPELGSHYQGSETVRPGDVRRAGGT